MKQINKKLFSGEKHKERLGEQAIFNVKQALIIAALVLTSFVLGFIIGAFLAQC